MKRLANILIALTLTISMLCSLTVFAEGIEDSKNYQYYKTETLDATKNALKDYIYNMLDTRQEEFAISVTGKVLAGYTRANPLILSDITQEIIDNYIKDTSRGYNVLMMTDYSHSESSMYYVDTEEITEVRIEYKMTWLETAEQTASSVNWAKDIVKEIITEDMGHYERIETLHDYVVNRFNYDTNENVDAIVKNASEMIEKGIGVCSSYTAVTYLLLNEAGYESKIVVDEAYAKNDKSDPVKHCWNMVKINDNWYHIDTTWDDPVTQSGAHKLVHDYFLISTEKITADHSYTEQLYPESLTNYDSSAAADKENLPQIAPFVEFPDFPGVIINNKKFEDNTKDADLSLIDMLTSSAAFYIILITLAVLAGVFRYKKIRSTNH